MQGNYIAEALAPFEPKVAEYFYEPRPQSARGRRGGRGSWRFIGKLIDMPAPQGGTRRWKSLGEKFVSVPANRDFLESLAVTVVQAGYIPPLAPADMTDMPRRPLHGIRSSDDG